MASKKMDDVKLEGRRGEEIDGGLTLTLNHIGLLLTTTYAQAESDECSIEL